MPREQFVYDSLPPADDDYKLEFQGFHGCDSYCRIRVYKPRRMQHGILIVASEPIEATYSGTSITNMAELVHCQAWLKAGEPNDVTFVEHYPERQADKRWFEPLDAEHFDIVGFNTDPETDQPHLTESHIAGRIVAIDPLLGEFGSNVCGSTGVEILREYISDKLAFVNPDWHRLTRETMQGLLSMDTDRRLFPSPNRDRSKRGGE